jgi:glycosyltransferase involved in cell wall biosynthesis
MMIPMTARNCTILIPTWNRGDYLVRAVQSALEQGNQVDEILIIDNCSESEFTSFLNYVKALDSRIQVFNQNVNIGAVGNWLSGLRRVRTEWVKMLFSDDILEPDCLEELMNFQKIHDLDVVACSAYGIVNNITYNFYLNERVITSNFDRIAQKIANREFPISPTAALVRTADAIRMLEKFTNSQKLINSAIGPDLFLMYGVVCEGGRFGFLDKQLVTMFGDGANISSQQEHLLSGYYAEAFLRMLKYNHKSIPLTLRFKLWFRILRSAISTW